MSDIALPWFQVEAPTRPSRRRWRTGGAVLGAIVVIWFGVGTWTGAPGPGALRRFPAADLHAFADGINASGLGRCEASVGLASSRVVVVIPLQHAANRDRRLDECAALVASVIETDPSRFSPAMISGEIVHRWTACDDGSCE